jgi:hypothetical protein
MNTELTPSTLIRKQSASFRQHAITITPLRKADILIKLFEVRSPHPGLLLGYPYKFAKSNVEAI